MQTLTRLTTLLAAVGLALAAAADASPQVREHPSAAILQVFHERIAAYATLRRELASSRPPLVPSDDPRTFLAAQAALASAIKTSRPEARQGDIFSPAVAVVFRRILQDALCGRDTETLLSDLYEEHSTPQRSRLDVHDRYPDWATHEVPVVLLHRLPRLPSGIVYRLIDHDLLLWDADANLIVDILPAAIARPTS
jgi:hypothetical protein